MPQLVGNVRAGKGEHAHWMSVYREAYRAETGIDPVPGTLNVELAEPWQMPPDASRFSAGVTILLTRCQIDGIDGFIMRTENNERGIGDHPPNMIEVISDTHLRDSLDLQDNDRVTITLP